MPNDETVSLLRPVLALIAKELQSLGRDRVLLVLIVWAFTGAIYAAATGVSKELHNAPIAIVDHDHSALSARIAAAIRPPQFLPPRFVTWDEVDSLLDRGEVSFVLVIPPTFKPTSLRVVPPKSPCGSTRR
ncbi:hypothetical protein [Hydrogenophilus thermoluteolus]|uniref:hypothetical protein n=1 Tax=Hydrogenophilus thermoluteolus TaxID=297 RepID=UPI003F67F11B